jgi:hypothetical protein
MTLTPNLLDEFFQTFATSSNSTDPTIALPHFADNFLVAGPDGALTVSAREFAHALPKRKQLFDKAGCRSSTLLSKQENWLDARYLFVKTQWRFEFADPSAPELEGCSTFLIDAGGSAPKILVYMAHQDIFKLLQARGLYHLNENTELPPEDRGGVPGVLESGSEP